MEQNDRLLCYDKKLGMWWIMDSTKVNEVESNVNAQLCSAGGLSINEIIDVINESLPTGEKLPYVGLWGSQCGIIRITDDVVYRYKGTVGASIVCFDFVPE